MEVSVEPFGGSRQEGRPAGTEEAQYRIAEKEPVFVAAGRAATTRWILILPAQASGRRDRNLPMGGGGVGGPTEGTTYRHGVDPKYNIKLTTESAPNGGRRIKPAEPLASGESRVRRTASRAGRSTSSGVPDFAVD